MAYNKQHHTTFDALLQVYGVPKELASRIAGQLAYVDNTEQDKLIEFMTVELQKKLSPQPVSLKE